MKLTHGTYECSVGTQEIPGCDCRPCTAAWKARLEARKSFSYYKAPESYRRSTKGRSDAKKQRERRETVSA